MKRFFFLVIFFIMGFGYQTSAQVVDSVYVAPWENHPMPLNLRFTAVYVDTLTIRSPLLINVNGLGFVTPEKIFNPYNPTSCLKSLETCAMMFKFIGQKAIDLHPPMLIIENPKISTERYEAQPYKDILTKFEYSRTLFGYDIYKCQQKELLLAVYLVQISTYNELSNSFIEWNIEVIEDDPKYLEALYPELEYIRVAVPIVFKKEGKEE